MLSMVQLLERRIQYLGACALVDLFNYHLRRVEGFCVVAERIVAHDSSELVVSHQGVPKWPADTVR